MSFVPGVGGPTMGAGDLGGAGGAWSQEAISGAGAADGSGGGDGQQNVDAAFKLQVEEGATVSATFPFFGDPEGGQLSFQIGDHIEVREQRRPIHRGGLRLCSYGTMLEKGRRVDRCVVRWRTLIRYIPREICERSCSRWLTVRAEF